ncbi:MAG TPA: hypothetical protein PLM49_03265 [Bacteroidales bacterium]|jgi:hypothetical protein|nr:hypothetical protein [Bacteroidales bacterium]
MAHEKLQQLNKAWVGLLLGLLLPLLAFLVLYAYKSYDSDTLVLFINRLKLQGAFISVLSLCVLPNLLLFFTFKKLDFWYAIKGVVASVFFYTILVVVLKFA